MDALAVLLDVVFARRRLAADVDGALGAHHGLALGDLALLLELRGAPGQRMRRRDLARRLGVTPSGIARQVAPLERMGVVGREPGRDARVALVTLTLAGARLADAAAATAREAAAEALGRVWNDPELAQLGSLLAAARA